MDEPTATATFHNLFEETPEPTSNGQPCPNGTAGGWGTVTPGLWWRENCDKCINSGNGTPTVTGTLPPTAQPTATTIENQGPFLVVGLSENNLYGSGTATGYIRCHSDVAPYDYIAYNGQSFGAVGHEVDCLGEMEVSGGDDSSMYIRAYVWSGHPNNTSGSWYVNFDVNPVGNNCTSGAICEPGYYSYSEQKLFESRTVHVNGSGSFYFYLYARQVGFEDTPTVQPTLEATPESYCNTVEPVGGAGDVVSLPTVLVGEGACHGIVGFTLPLHLLSFLGLNFEDVVVPDISICLDPMEISDFTVAGVLIHTGMIFYGIAVIGCLMIWFNKK